MYSCELRNIQCIWRLIFVISVKIRANLKEH